MRTTLSPRPGLAFWDRIARKYARKPIDDPAAYEAKLARVRAALRPSDRVLEIGCGTGSTALRLAPGVAHVTATDGSGAMIAIARAKLGAGAPGNVAFLHADAADPVPGGPFDAVCAFSLLHLVDDVPRVLDTVRGQLKPGGLFLSKTVCLGDKPAAIRVLVRVLVRVLAALGLAPPVTALSRTGLVRQLIAAGFEIEETRYFGPQRLSPFIVARRARA